MSRSFPAEDDAGSLVRGLFVAFNYAVESKEVNVSGDGAHWLAYDVYRGSKIGGINAATWSAELGFILAIGIREEDSTFFVAVSDDGANWIEVGSMPAGQHSWADVAWSPELGLFVAVDAQPNIDSTVRVATSPDGIHWTIRNTPDAGLGRQLWNGVAWSPELGVFVVVGGNQLPGAPDYAMTSPNGVNWTLRALPTMDGQYNSPRWVSELGLFVVAGTQVLTSPDGLVWSAHGAAAGKISVGLAWSPLLQKFASAGWEDYPEGTADSLLVSSDGVNWVANPAPGFAAAYYQMAWSPRLKRFLTVGIVDEFTPSQALSSRNGVDWNLHSAVGHHLLNVLWVPDLPAPVEEPPSAPTGLVATAGNHQVSLAWTAPPQFITSYTVKRSLVPGGPYVTVQAGISVPTFVDTGLVNGTTYYYVVSATNDNGESPNSNEDDGTPVAPPTLLVAVAPFGGTASEVVTSPDAVNWTKRSSAVEHGWNGVAWSPSLALFAAVAEQGNGSGGNLQRVMTSPDGIAWTARGVASSLALPSWKRITWSPSLGLFVAVARISGNATKVMTSPDGINWTGRASPTGFWVDIVWSPELSLFVVIGDSGTNKAMTSPDGVNWTGRITPAVGWVGVTWGAGAGLFVAVASNAVMTSPNGVNWTSRAAAANLFWNSVAWSPSLGLFVAVASNGVGNRVMTSPDGVNWTSRVSASDSGWLDVVWNADLALFVAISGTAVMTSVNGINWVSQVVPNGGWADLTFK